MVTVFRSWRRADDGRAYDEVAAAMEAAARAAPGGGDGATVTATDGERVTVATFASEADHRAWRDDPGHRAAQGRGRAEFYDAYRVQVATCTSVTRWTRVPATTPGDDVSRPSES